MPNTKILFNTKRIKVPSNLEVIINIDNDVMSEININEEDKTFLLAYLAKTRTYLEKIKNQINTMIDANATKQDILNVIDINAIQDNSALTANPHETASSFLNKAYTMQVGGENRYQPYINAGILFNGYTGDETKPLLLFHAGKIICLINTIISQIHRVNDYNNQNNDENFKHTVPTLAPMLNNLSDELNTCSVIDVNTGFFANLRNDFLVLLNEFINWLSAKLTLKDTNDRELSP